MTAGREKLATLYLDACGFGHERIWVDTVMRGILGHENGAKPPALLARSKTISRWYRRLRDEYSWLSYMADWRDAFVASSRLAVEICNVNNLVQLAGCLRRIHDYDLVVVSHAAAGDAMTVTGRIGAALRRRRGVLVSFIGNEYALLDQKIAFLNEAAADYICTQLPLAAARYLYQGLTGALVDLPHALNPVAYHPLNGVARTGDIGFIGDIYPHFIGDRERTDLIEWFAANASARGLACDIRRVRLPRADWHVFLAGHRGIIGAESGTYFLNDRGGLMTRAAAYEKAHPEASFVDIHARFFAGLEGGVSGKCISSRHFEPVGTKTCQILLEGEYNGVLRAGEHYIPVRRDLSDVDEAIRQFADAGTRDRIAENAYHHVMSGHTYAHRVETLLARIGAA